jgi:hypothetical protein
VIIGVKRLSVDLLLTSKVKIFGGLMQMGGTCSSERGIIVPHGNTTCLAQWLATIIPSTAEYS